MRMALHFQSWTSSIRDQVALSGVGQSTADVTDRLKALWMMRQMKMRSGCCCVVRETPVSPITV